MALVRLGAGLAKFLAGAGLAVLVFLTGAYFQVRGALPPYSGHVEAAGLKAPVEILRDKNAVPHIIAGSIEDAAFGLGYVHAQDRFWQMELMRRLGQGRLSEIIPPSVVGSGLIDNDRTMRGLGLYRQASESVNALSPGTRTMLESYAAGVNAWLKDDDQQYGLELTLIKLLSGGRYRPEPWRPADSLVWAKLMALGLDGNWRAELLRLRLARKIGDDGVKFLIEPSGDNGDATLSLVRAATQGIDLDRLYRATDNVATRKREASNEWVLSGAHAVSGKPLLANDPHLALTFPGIWYLARLVGPGFDIRGASSPGSPAIVLGHNGTIGWGFTTTNLDSQDLFVERVDPTDPSRYITPDGARPFAVRDETINVLWGDPVPLRVRQTRHGVVIDDFIRPARRPARSDARRPCAGAAGDGARRRRHLGRRLCPPRPGAELGRIPDGGAQDRLADAEHRLCRHRRQHRPDLAGARADPAQGRRLDAGARLDGGVRLGGLRAVRRPAPRLQPGQRHPGQRQRPGWCRTTTATSSAATGPNPTASAAPTSFCTRSSAIRSTA